MPSSYLHGISGKEEGSSRLFRTSKHTEIGDATREIGERETWLVGKKTNTQFMVTTYTWMMTVDTATNLIALLANIDDKKRRTHNIDEKPPPIKFQWHIIQTTVFACLSFSHSLQQMSMTLWNMRDVQPLAYISMTWLFIAADQPQLRSGI